MKNKTAFSLLLVVFCLFFVGCLDSSSNPAEPQSISAATQTPANTPIGLTPSPTQTFQPPTATNEPSPTPGPTGTPTPLSVATAPATLTPTPSKTRLTLTDTPTPLTYSAKSDAYLEWILPEATPQNLVSISGGRINGFGIDGDYAFIFMGRTMAIVDMSVEPIGEEIARFLFSDLPSDAVRSGRFLFVRVNNIGVKVFDFTDPANPSPVAWIKGLGGGRLHLGENGQVLYERSQGNWLELDVDQVEPAFWLPEAPITAGISAEVKQFENEIFLPNWEFIADQVDEIMPGGTHWFPGNVQIQGDDAFYQTATRGEAGGGQVVRLDISDPDNLRVKSIFRSFETGNFDVEDGFAYPAFLYEFAGGGSLVDVRDPAKPTLNETLVFGANAHTVIGNNLLAGYSPGLVAYSLDNGLTQLTEQPFPQKRPRFNYLDQLVMNPERTLLFGLTGLYGETGDIVIYSTENPAEPLPLSFIEASMIVEIKYAAGRLYTYRTGGAGESVIEVYDVSDPGNPEYIMGWVTEERVIGLEAWQDETGRHLIAALTPDELSIQDVSDPGGIHKQLGRIFARPECVFVPNGDRYHRHTTIAGNWLFASLGNCPTNRIDISNPANPIILETLDSSGPMIFEDGLLFMGGQNLRIYKFN